MKKLFLGLLTLAILAWPSGGGAAIRVPVPSVPSYPPEISEEGVCIVDGGLRFMYRDSYATPDGEVAVFGWKEGEHRLPPTLFVYWDQNDVMIRAVLVAGSVSLEGLELSEQELRTQFPSPCDLPVLASL